MINTPLTEEQLLSLGFTKVAPLNIHSSAWWRIEIPDFSWCWTSNPSFAMIIGQVRHQAITETKRRMYELFGDVLREAK